MRKLFALALVAGALSVSACDQQATEPGGNGSITGTWKYTATGFRPVAAGPDTVLSCSIETTYTVRQEGNEIEGVAPDVSATTCTNGVRTWRDTNHGGVVRGEIRDGRIYITNAGGWHSFGERVGADRFEGYLESYGSYDNGPDVTRRSGSFTMERISHQGYGGPRA